GITEGKGTVVDIEEDAGTRTKRVFVQGKSGTGEYVVPFTARMKVAVGDEVHRGAPLTEGSIQPKRLLDRKSTRLNSSHVSISYAVFCLNKKKLHLNTLCICTYIFLYPL